LAKEPGKVYRPPDFDPLLAIHRLKKVEMTERFFEYPVDYDFNEVFDRSFGLVKEDYFEVEIEFQEWAADCVAERTWSPDQKISKVGDDTIRTFGEEAKVIHPEWVVDEIIKKIRRTAVLYSVFKPFNGTRIEVTVQNELLAASNGTQLNATFIFLPEATVGMERESAGILMGVIDVTNLKPAEQAM
jgi:hypothetical protein